jgi:hypothetical protein
MNQTTATSLARCSSRHHLALRAYRGYWVSTRRQCAGRQVLIGAVAHDLRGEDAAFEREPDTAVTIEAGFDRGRAHGGHCERNPER